MLNTIILLFKSNAIKIFDSKGKMRMGSFLVPKAEHVEIPSVFLLVKNGSPVKWIRNSFPMADSQEEEEKEKEPLLHEEEKSAISFEIEYSKPGADKRHAFSPVIERKTSHLHPRRRPSQERRRGFIPLSRRDIRSSEGEIVETPNLPKHKRRKSKKTITFQEENVEADWTSDAAVSTDDRESSSMMPASSKSEVQTNVGPSRTVLESQDKPEAHLVTESRDYHCLIARSALILPFVYEDEDEHMRSASENPQKTKEKVVKWVNELKQREFVKQNGETARVWLPRAKLPGEAADLSPHFKQIFGYSEFLPKRFSSFQTEKTWTAHRLMLNDEVLKTLLNDAKLHTVQNGEEILYEVQIEAIELLLYPLGNALLALHIDWMPPNSKMELTLNEFRTLLFISKARHKTSGLFNGWGFTSESLATIEKVEELKLPQKHMDCLGDRLYEAKYLGKTVSLSTLGNWLLHLPGEDPSAPMLRLDYSRHAQHHTTVVIDREPPEDLLHEYLFHLRRAFGQKNRPPPYSETSLGRVLVWRKNRYVGISREGNVSLSWNTESDDFEVKNWWKKFQGIYLLLALHAHAERMIFFELSDVAAVQAENLDLGSELVGFEHMKVVRAKLRSLASLMIQYTLSMSSNDCGGTSEYSEFFTVIRQVYLIPELREELSSELMNVLALVESTYLEEERRQRYIEETERKREIAQSKEHQSKRDEVNRRYDLIVSVLGAITVPFVLISSIFGMNLDNLPTHLDFAWVMVISTILSIALFLVLLAIRMVGIK